MSEPDLSKHEFGGISTDLKLSIVEGYLKFFTTALRPNFRELVYIDAFAGTGERTVTHAAIEASILDEGTPARIERLQGSAQIAINTVPKFDRLLFIDQNPKHCAALQALKAANPAHRIEVEEGEANAVLRRILAEQNWSGCRGVLFLDPYGMSVPWKTLESIRATEALDVWYLVSLAGLYRQAVKDRNALTADKRAAITRMLGYDGWETEWYGKTSSHSLFDEVDEREYRTADVKMIEETVRKRLATLFPAVSAPLTLHNDRGLPMNSLFFLPSNPRPRAYGLAMKIANHILRSGSSSQSRPR